MEGKNHGPTAVRVLAYVVNNRNHVGLFKQKRNFLQGYQVAHRIHRNQVQKPRMEPRSAGCWNLYQGYATGKTGPWLPALDTGHLFYLMNSKHPAILHQWLQLQSPGQEVRWVEVTGSLAAGIQKCKHMASEAFIAGCGAPPLTKDWHKADKPTPKGEFGDCRYQRPNTNKARN